MIPSQHSPHARERRAYHRDYYRKHAGRRRTQRLQSKWLRWLLAELRNAPQEIS